MHAASDLAEPGRINAELRRQAAARPHPNGLAQAPDGGPAQPDAWERRRDLLHGAARALAWGPTLDAAGRKERGLGPALRDRTLGVELQRALLRVRCGVTHAAYVRDRTHRVIACSCGHRPGAWALETLLHVFLCANRLVGPDSSDATLASLVDAARHALAPAAHDSLMAKAFLNEARLAEALSLGPLARTTLHGSAYTEFGRVVDKWFRSVYGASFSMV